MAGKKGKNYGVEKIGEKYVCEDCQVEIPIHKPCPACNKHIDWDRVLEESKVR